MGCGGLNVFGVANLISKPYIGGMDTTTEHKPDTEPTDKPVTEPAEEEKPKRRMTDEHKQRIAEGHRQRDIVSTYLDAINIPKRRGRRLTLPQLQERLSEAQRDLNETSGTDRLKAAQTIVDLEERIAQREQEDLTEQLFGEMEKRFIEVAATYAERHDISRKAWREVGVSPAVLKKAGIR